MSQMSVSCESQVDERRRGGGGGREILKAFSMSLLASDIILAMSSEEY